MKFQLIVFGLFNFLHIRFSWASKASGITPWKKMLLATALALLITGCAQQTFTVQNKPAAVAPKETITHHFFVSGIGRKTVDAAKICGAEEMLLKRNPANIRKWIARFYYFRHLYSAGSACVLLTIIAWVAHRYGQLYLHCSLIYFWVPSSCLHSDQPLWGWNNPVQRCLPVGGGCIIHAGGGGGFTRLTDCFDVQPASGQRQHHHAEHHFRL